MRERASALMNPIEAKIAHVHVHVDGQDSIVPRTTTHDLGENGGKDGAQNRAQNHFGDRKSAHSTITSAKVESESRLSAGTGIASPSASGNSSTQPVAAQLAPLLVKGTRDERERETSKALQGCLGMRGPMGRRDCLRQAHPVGALPRVSGIPTRILVETMSGPACCRPGLSGTDTGNPGLGLTVGVSRETCTHTRTSTVGELGQ